jgi:hypothetical protein
MLLTGVEKSEYCGSFVCKLIGRFASPTLSMKRKCLVGKHGPAIRARPAGFSLLAYLFSEFIPASITACRPYAGQHVRAGSDAGTAESALIATVWQSRFCSLIPATVVDPTQARGSHPGIP